MARFREAFTILSRALSGETFSFSGEHFDARDVACVPRPVQRPRPPILNGGGRPGILSFAAREADAVSFSPRRSTAPSTSATPPEALDEKVRWIRAAAGARFAELTLDQLIFECLVTPNREPVVAALAAGMRLPPERVLELAPFLVGPSSRWSRRSPRGRARWCISHVAVPDTAMHAFAPVVERLAGR